MRTGVGLRIAVVLGLAGSMAPAASDVPPAPSPPSPPFTAELKAVFDDLNGGHYLAAIDRVGADASNPAFGEGDSNPFRQLFEQTRPFLDEDVDLAALPQGPDPADPKDAAMFEGAAARDAVAEIVRRARGTRIVVLNEAHHSPSDRAFALEVAIALRPLGYSTLAIEALSNPASGAEAALARLAADGYPRLKSGLYVKDPAFGDFVRRSLAIGYRPVSYEAPPAAGANAASPGERVAAREQAETDNLIARVFAREPQGKLLVYVGYAHAAEEPMEAGNGPIRWMAARLKAATGIDPLTVDQTTVSQFSTSPGQRRLYALVAPRLRDRPAVFVRAGQPVKAGALGRATDLQVVHPPLKRVGGRPTWLLSMGRRPVAIPRALLPRSGRRLVQAFIAGEAPDAIPVDQVVVQAGKPAPVLMLPPRRIRYAVQDPPPAQPRLDAEHRP